MTAFGNVDGEVILENFLGWDGTKFTNENETIALRVWLDRNTLSAVSITVFLLGIDYEAQRKAAIDNFNL